MSAQQITSWGRYPSVLAERLVANDHTPQLFQKQNFHGIPRGLGRSYGDAALASQLLDMTRRDCFIHFDENTGLLTLEAGVSLARIIETFLPRGWFLPVTPGTQFVTVGGAFASDVHGKNHHKDGSFSDFVSEIWLLRSDFTEMLHCTPDQNTAIFHATRGGMGLTGVIWAMTLQLKRVPSAWIAQTVTRCQNLKQIIQALKENDAPTYTVAWIDCVARGEKLGRSVLFCGEHSDQVPSESRRWEIHFKNKQNKKSVPLDFPSWALNAWSVRAFNQLYYTTQRPKATPNLVHYTPFFYPLDGILGWNKIYGKRGFVQYQCVIPDDAAEMGLKQLFEKITASGRGSFLAVLKRLGAANAGLLSFPMAGYTLALDFAYSDETLKLLNELDAVTRDHGGRVYLAKDARMSAEFFAESIGVAKLTDFRRYCDPALGSLLSQRLNII